MRTNAGSRLLSSPGSPNDPVSGHGSPETRITPFSPEIRRSGERSGSAATGRLLDSGLRNVYSAHADPFLGSPGPSARRGLSPTAASFTPIGMNSAVTERGHASRLAFEPGSRAATSALVPSSDYSGPEPVRIGRQRAARDASLLANGTPSGSTAENLEAERRTRAFMVENVPSNLPYLALANFFDRHDFTTLKGPVIGDMNTMGRFCVAFADGREAKRAFEKVQRLQPTWRLIPLTAREYVQHADATLLQQTSDFEGQLTATVFFDSRNQKLNRMNAGQTLQAILATFGDIKTFLTLPAAQANVSEFHVEFFNTRDAENAVASLNNTAASESYFIGLALMKPDLEREVVRRPANTSPVNGHSQTEPATQAITPTAVGRPARSPHAELSPTGRSTVTRGEHAGLIDWMARSGERIVPNPRREVGRFSDFRLNNQNAVDVERIRLGLDVRTTIMLRNIPNKVSQPLLKAIVDETSLGKYDFMYLRIDFANNCNVGYAFINFEDPIDIVDFVETRAGRTWNCFNSDKVAEVSYATIQGKDCLVQKFRNSSVMLEDREFRPKLFHTGTGPVAGSEDRFPGPDNPSKMRRSIENAENIGLFAPRVSQQYRMEQRRRRSQFDRGTSAAEREVAYVQTAGPVAAREANGEVARAPLSPPDVHRGSRRTVLSSDVNSGIRRAPRTRLALPDVNGVGSSPLGLSVDNTESARRAPLPLPGPSTDIIGRAPLSPPEVNNGLARAPLSPPPRVNNALARAPLSPDVGQDVRRAPFTPANVTAGRQTTMWSPIDITYGLRSAPPRTRTVSQIWYEEDEAKRGPITS